MKSRFCDGSTRRDLLRVGMLGGAGLSLADFLRLSDAQASAAPARADAAIYIHFGGGPSHLDTLDMKPEAPVEERSPFALISSAIPGLQVCDQLPRLAKALGDFTLIRGFSHSAGAHPQANHYLFTGNRPSPAVLHPAAGSVVQMERPSPPDVPGFVAIPGTEMQPGFLGVSFAAFKTTSFPDASKPYQVRGLSLTGGLTPQRIQDRERLLADLDGALREAESGSGVLTGLDRFGKKAQAMILSARSRDAFDTSRESPSLAKQFGADTLSQSLLLAARLVEHGVRFVTVTHSGWDTHLDNIPSLKSKLLPPLDAALPALVSALKEKGLLSRTLVMAGGEFGRTPTVNKNGGRDHWPRAGWMLMAGGGVASGKLVGGTDRKGHGPDDSTHITPDDLCATLYHLLGLDPHKEYHTSTGRPVVLVPEGRVIQDVLA